MDNLTHSLVGLTLARAGFGRGVPYAAATLVIASNAPDADFVAGLSGGSLAYLAVHRGPTHGPLGVVLLAAATALGVLGAAIVRRRAAAGAAPLDLVGCWRLSLLAVAAVALHVAMDLPTSYGTRLLTPFVGTWFAFDWMPIIDVYLWAILAGGLLAGAARPAWRSRAALIVLLLVAGDYAVRGGLHQAALRAGAATTAAGAQAQCATQPTLVRHPIVIEAAAAGPDACIQAAALPTFLSPFTWRIVRQHPAGYELSERSVFRPSGPAPATWIPSESGEAVARARASGSGRIFVDFARFPASRVVRAESDTVTVRIADVRFMGSPLRFDPSPRARAPFVLTVEVHRDGRILREALGD